MENLRIGIIGTGSMGGAILAGLLKSGLPADHIFVSTKSSASAENLNSRYGVIAKSTELNSATNSEIAKNSDVLIIAVKPNQILELLTELSPNLKPESLVISVAAGITTSAMEQVVSGAAVVRAMPNTPSIFGLGVTGIAKGESANQDHLKLAEQLFRTIGEVLVVPEQQINALSTISGSGPAYVFYFAEKLIAAAEELGFTKEQAEQMVKGTFMGSAKLLLESELTPQQLRQQVTSPNGTTMQAIAKFDQADLEKIFIEATKAALERAIEMGRLNS